MKVKVKYHGVIRDITGGSTAEFDVPDDASVSDLLGHMREQYGQAFEDRVLDDRMGIQTYILIFLNNEEVDQKALSTTRLSTGGEGAEATLYVLPGSTGGESVRVQSPESRVQGQER